jgi:hypothetical protein
MFRKLALLVFVSSTPVVGHAAEPVLAVRNLSLGTSVAGREVQGVGERFAADSEVWAHVTLVNPGDPAPVTMVWLHAGKEMQRTTLTAGHASRWRTWAHKHLTAPGDWRVEVRDAGGAVLAGANFVVEGKAPGA